MPSRRIRLLLSMLLLALVQAGSAAALTYTPTVTIGRVGGPTWDMLDPANAVDYTLSAPDANGAVTWAFDTDYDFVRANYTVTDWTIQLKEDPFVTNNVTLTNTSTINSTFVATVILPIPAFAYNTVINSSVGVTFTDSNTTTPILLGNDTFGTPIYQGFVGFPVSTNLLTMNPIVPFGTFPIDSTTDCFPPGGGPGCTAIASNFTGSLAVPPGVATVIGLTLTFQLSPGDSVGLTSRFEIVNVPEPTTLALLGVGLAGLALARRRSA